MRTLPRNDDLPIFPRKETTLEKLAKLPPAFDRTSGHGTLSAGNSSLLTDGAAAIWVGSQNGIEQLPASIPRVRLIDWAIAAIDFRHEGLLMAHQKSVLQGKSVAGRLNRGGSRSNKKKKQKN